MASQVAVRQIPIPAARHASNLVSDASVHLGGRAWLLAHDDLRDPAALLVRLRSSQDSLARYLHDQLAAETRKLLGDFSGSGAVPAPLLQGLTSDLNRVLQEKSLFDANRDFFSRFTLSPATRRLVDEARWQEDIVRLNRLILEETFPREIKKSPIGYQASILFPGATLTANQNLQRDFLIYAGPKEYKTLSRLGADLHNDIDRLMEYGGFFGWFAQLLLLSMNALHSFGLDYGSAIIVITIIIKILFWPLTNLSTRSMKRMAALQPQMKVIQDKYKDDPQKMQRKMMEFYKEHKINPASGCLPVLVQMPIFFGFYQMIRTAIELRGARFLWNYDLSKPDTLFIIPGLDLPFNLLPLIMGATMVWQARLTPVSPGVDPMQQKIMKYMPLMFLALLYNFSAGLTLYWTVQNLLSIVQMKLTRSKDQPAAMAPVPSPVTPQFRKRK
jgi:YidC/Oxa1 family membrane protein insertase